MALAPSLQDMVAFLYPGGRPSSARQATGELRHTTIKLVPRQGMTAAWRDQLMDACNVHGCARLLDEPEPLSFEAVLAHMPSVQAPARALTFPGARVPDNVFVFS